MRHLESSFVFALLVACGGPSPDAAGPAATAGGEARCVEGALQGRWLLIEPDDEEAAAALELVDGAGLMTLGREGTSRPVLGGTSPGQCLHELVLPAMEGEEEMHLYWMFESADRALLFRPDDDDLVQAYRTGPVPEPLRGQWMVVEIGSDRPTELELTENRASTRRNGRVAGGDAFGVSEGLAMSLSEGGETETVLLHVRSAGPELFLAWPNGDDDLLVMYRPGGRPNWMPAQR